MKKILVPCDFSDSAVQAFRFAADIARQSKGEVMLLNVVELPVLHDTVLMPTLYFEEAYLKNVKAEALKNFGKLQTKWAKEGPALKPFIEYGGVAPTISRFIKEKKIDLVVMGTQGASGLREFVVGSNTEKIVRRSGVPVIAIRKYVKTASIRNIVFPNTLEVDQEEMTMKIKALQEFFKARLHVVYINTPANFKTQAEANLRLKDFARRFMLKDFTINVYNDLDQEMGILNYVKDGGADMLVMATHGRRGISHLLSGSIAEDVVNHIQCPIWTCVSR